MNRYTLKQARNLSGLTQTEVAERIGINTFTYMNHESYRTIMRMDKAYAFSKAVGIDISNIIFFETELQKNCSKEKQMN